ncbi:MAG: phage capsid protein [Planctomycetota bacterium]
MSVANFIPEIWSAGIQTSMKKKHVFVQCCNKDYEGDVKSGGSVKITSVGRPTVATYVPGTTAITPEGLTSAQRTLMIDQNKYWCFEIEDVDKVQAASGQALMDESIREGAYAFADTADLYVASLFEAGVAAANVIGATKIDSATLAVQYVVALATLLDEANVPEDGRYCIVPPWFHGYLLQDDRFVRADASGSTAALRNGFIGQAFGFDVLKSNSVTLVTGDDYRVCAGHSNAITFADQIDHLEAFRPESGFQDAVKANHVYGGKVVRPTALATLLASKTTV